jgi:hypothetical protein
MYVGIRAEAAAGGEQRAVSFSNHTAKEHENLQHTYSKMLKMRKGFYLQ